MRVRDLHYELPQELIARYPTERRDGARMLEVGRDGVAHRHVRDLPQLLEPGSLLSEICAESEDTQLGLRLAAFCLPNLCHLHRGALCAVTSRGFRELMRALPLLAPSVDATS